MSLMPTMNGRPMIAKVATYTLALLLVGLLLGLMAGTVGAYIIETGLGHVESGP